jgi:hypothetical protein
VGWVAAGFLAGVRAEDAAEAFAARMRDAELRGTWMPLRAGALGAEQPDAYRVARATPVEGERWEIVWKIQRRGQTVEVPLPCLLRFAGDAAVLALDDVPVGEGKAYSARILFHGDVYTGRWWGADGEGGLVSGTVRPTAAGKPDAP